MHPDDRPTLAELQSDDLDDRVRRLVELRLDRPDRPRQQYPYVGGDGADGARRSAAMDREELASMGAYNPRVHDDDDREHGAYLDASARAWDLVAVELDRQESAAGVAELREVAHPDRPAER